MSEGLLGGRLAQRQAALRDMLAAGARVDFPLVYRACRLAFQHLVCQIEKFLWKPTADLLSRRGTGSAFPLVAARV